jgi:hypothetical protein
VKPLFVHRAAASGAPSSRPGLAAAVKAKPAAAAAIGGVGLVLLIALLRKGGSTDAGTTGTGTSTFDSTANDLYNSIQPEIDALAQKISDLQGKQPAPDPTPVPVTNTPIHIADPPPFIVGPGSPKPPVFTNPGAPRMGSGTAVRIK